MGQRKAPWPRCPAVRAGEQCRLDAHHDASMNATPHDFGPTPAAPEPRWHRNLRTAANAGEASGLKTVPAYVADLREALEVLNGFTLAGVDAEFAYRVGRAIKDPRALLRLAFDRLEPTERLPAVRECVDQLETAMRRELLETAARSSS